MKVLIATGLYPPEIGGPATYSKILNDELPKRGIDVSVLPFSMVRQHWKVVRHFVYFLRVLRQGRTADIIFAQDPVSVGFPAMAAAKMLRKKFFLRLGGDYAWEQAVGRYGVADSLDDFSKKEAHPFFIKILKYIQKSVALRSEKVIVPSNYLKEIVINWGIDKGKIQVIYNAFTVPKTGKNKHPLRDALNLSGTVILSAGRLVPWKGFKTLIALFPKVLEFRNDAKLLIAGDGPDLAKLNEKVKTLNLENSVIFLGKLPNEKLLQYIQAADVFVLNTGYEGFSHQLLEVMATGTPIITTSVGGNRELIKNDDTGILVEYNNQREIINAIAHVLESDQVQEKLSQSAKKKAGEFTKERMIQETIKELSS